MFRTGNQTDFDRMLNDILRRAKTTAADTSNQIQAAAAARGSLLSSGTAILMERQIAPIHEAALSDVMRLIVQFSERTGNAIPDLCDTARPKLASFASDILDHMIVTANRLNLTQFVSQARQRF